MNKIIRVPGSIYKSEFLQSVEKTVIENTTVLEATYPYDNYYGQVPQIATPNSIFLLTQQFYFLEEILALISQVSICLQDEIDFATASINYNGRQFPAIRLKHFPDYNRIINLQRCLKAEGVRFILNNQIKGNATSRVQKFFELRELEPAIYIDNTEKNKGYVFCDNQFNLHQFEKTLQQLKNNGKCGLMDVVQGEILIDGILVKIIRVFAEGIGSTTLKCIKAEFDRAFSGKGQRAKVEPF